MVFSPEQHALEVRNLNNLESKEELSRYSYGLLYAGSAHAQNDQPASQNGDNSNLHRQMQGLVPNGALPEIELYRADQRLDVKISGKHGHRDTVVAVVPHSGETISELLHRLHPELSSMQIEKQVAQTIRYNRNYGNNIDGGTPLNSNQKVYLTSLRTSDANGRITRIEAPDGRITEISYQSGELAGYTICKPDGTIVEQASKTSDGDFMIVNSDGRRARVQQIQLDVHGNLIERSNNVDICHLTRGDDIETTLNQDGKPINSYVIRNGILQDQFSYTYNADTQPKIIDVMQPNQNGGENSQPQNANADMQSGQTIDGNEQADMRLNDSIGTDASTDMRQRLNESVGDMESDGSDARKNDAGGSPRNLDFTLESSVGNLQKRMLAVATSLLGHAVTEFKHIDPRYGCAQMVSEILLHSGFPPSIENDNCDLLANNLREHGFHLVTGPLKVGDIIMGGNNDHTAIYAGGGKVLGNSYKLQRFNEDTFADVFGKFPYCSAWRYD